MQVIKCVMPREGGFRAEGGRWCVSKCAPRMRRNCLPVRFSFTPVQGQGRHALMIIISPGRGWRQQQLAHTHTHTRVHIYLSYMLRFISFLGAGVFDDDRPVRSLKPVGSVASRLSDLVSRRTVESGQDQRRCIEEEEEERRRRRRRGTI